MLHADSQRRIADITRMADLFEEKGYRQTANEILSFAKVLKAKKVPKDFLKKLDFLFVVFEKEFSELLPIGQDYRRKCFQEIKVIVFNAIGRMHPDFSKAILVLYPIFKRLNHAKKITGALAEEMGRERIQDKTVVLHLRCYAYLIIVEGIFDELARLLYFLTVVSKKKIPSLKELEKMSVWTIRRKLHATPVFLKNWREKKYIRDAIGHARVYYDTITPKIIHFVNLDEKKGTVRYDEFLTMSKFVEIALELEDSVDAFLYTLIMLRIYDLVISKNPYQ